jgi:hypothetical protein
MRTSKALDGRRTALEQPGDEVRLDAQEGGRRGRDCASDLRAIGPHRGPCGGSGPQTGMRIRGKRAGRLPWRHGGAHDRRACAAFGRRGGDAGSRAATVLRWTGRHVHQTSCVEGEAGAEQQDCGGRDRASYETSAAHRSPSFDGSTDEGERQPTTSGHGPVKGAVRWGWAEAGSRRRDGPASPAPGRSRRGIAAGRSPADR